MNNRPEYLRSVLKSSILFNTTIFSVGFQSFIRTNARGPPSNVLEESVTYLISAH